MQLIHTIAALRESLATGPHPAFVPTMGNLHEGHLELVREAARHGRPVVVSVFVNRLQFLPHEDFDQYPRTLARDSELLRGVGATHVFAPEEAALYPEPQTYTVHPPPALADILEGEFRPGFFTGVCTVVMKLFQCVQPALAVFGQKDYQQLQVMRGMVRQFALPIDIIGLPTLRAADGLALSSRNGYLSADERARAPQLRAALQQLAREARMPQPLPQAEAAARVTLTAAGWAPDYLTVRRRHDLLTPTDAERLGGAPLVALGAARLGRTRLIDNLEL